MNTYDKRKRVACPIGFKTRGTRIVDPLFMASRRGRGPLQRSEAAFAGTERFSVGTQTDSEGSWLIVGGAADSGQGDLICSLRAEVVGLQEENRELRDQCQALQALVSLHREPDERHSTARGKGTPTMGLQGSEVSDWPLGAFLPPLQNSSQARGYLLLRSSSQMPGLYREPWVSFSNRIGLVTGHLRDRPDVYQLRVRSPEDALNAWLDEELPLPLPIHV